MALALGEGSEFRAPVAVIGGLISLTIVSPASVPLIYELVGGFAPW